MKNQYGKEVESKAVPTRGSCVCPSCGYKMEHEIRMPCNEEKCPECGTTLIRV